jgi:hypothetical protein
VKFRGSVALLAGGQMIEDASRGMALYDDIMREFLRRLAHRKSSTR